MSGRMHFTAAQLESAARHYHSTRYAAEALGIAAGSFVRLCRRFDIETPNDRRRRVQQTRTSVLTTGA